MDYKLRQFESKPGTPFESFAVADMRAERDWRLYNYIREDVIRSFFDEHKVSSEGGEKLSDDEWMKEISGLYQVTGRIVNDIKRIFKYYAANADDGSAERMSKAEWWSAARDCRFMSSKATDTAGGVISKSMINSVFSESLIEDEANLPEGEKRNTNSFNSVDVGEMKIAREENVKAGVDEILELEMLPCE